MGKRIYRIGLWNEAFESPFQKMKTISKSTEPLSRNRSVDKLLLNCSQSLKVRMACKHEPSFIINRSLLAQPNCTTKKVTKLTKDRFLQLKSNFNNELPLKHQTTISAVSEWGHSYSSLLNKTSCRKLTIKLGKLVGFANRSPDGRST